MMGSARLFRRQVPAVADEGWRSDPAKSVFTRVAVDFYDGGFHARPSGGQMSNVLSALARADAFAVVPVGTGPVEAGDTVTLELFNAPEGRTGAEVLDG